MFNAICQPPFSEHRHRLNTHKGRLSRLKRFEPQREPCDPFHTTTTLLDDVVEILDLAEVLLQKLAFQALSRIASRSFKGLWP
jgi:hypothetical protein